MVRPTNRLVANRLVANRLVANRLVANHFDSTPLSGQIHNQLAGKGRWVTWVSEVEQRVDGIS
jgi:hypothetical protein